MEKANRKRTIVCILIIVFVLVETMLAFAYINNNTKRECIEALDGVATDVDTEMYWMMLGADGALQHLADMIVAIDDPSVEDIMKITGDAYTGIIEVLPMYLRPDGSAIYGNTLEEDISSKLKYADIVSDRSYISKVYENFDDPNRHVFINFCPVIKNGEVQGMLCVLTDVEMLNNYITTNAYGGQANAIMVDRRDGTIIIDTGRKQVSNLSFFDQNGVDHSEWNSAILEGRTASSNYLSSKSGKKRIVYTKPSIIENWSVIVAADENVIFEKLSGMRACFMIVMVTEALALIGYLSWVVSDTKKQVARERTLAAQAARAESEAEKKRLLEANLDVAKAANRAKTTFLNNMSHDIRTPMNAIIGFTRLAKDDIDDKAKVSDYLEKIDRSSDYLLSLINDVLDMSRIEAGKMEIVEREEQLSEIIAAVRDIVASVADERRISLSCGLHIEDDNVMCDKLRLRQAVVNVLSNAVKYTGEGGSVKLNITQSGRTDDGRGIYDFEISDTGIGMSKEFLDGIFEPFSRERSTTISGVRGTGLGMPITKNIVEMMGGSIQIESTEGVGTTVRMKFCFRLHGDSLKPREEKKEEENFSGKRLLLVEDNELNMEIAASLLEKLGFEIDRAENGQEAVEKVRASADRRYDAVLMDIQMPVMDGHEATRQIRALEDKTLAKVPIIAMTANAFEEDRRDALAAGMNDHVAKPIDLGQLLATLKYYL